MCFSRTSPCAPASVPGIFVDVGALTGWRVVNVATVLQGLFNQQGGLAQNGSSGNLASLQADVDSLMRANYMDSTQGNNAAMQVWTSKDTNHELNQPSPPSTLVMQWVLCLDDAKYFSMGAILRLSCCMAQVQALLNGSTNSLSSLQGGSHPNLAGMSGRGMGPGPNSSPLRSGPSVNMDSPSALLSAGSQHLSASQLFSLVRHSCHSCCCGSSISE